MDIPFKIYTMLDIGLIDMIFEIASLSDPDLYGKNIAAISESAQTELGVSKGEYIKTEGFENLNQILRVATLNSDTQSETEPPSIQLDKQIRQLILRSIGREVVLEPVEVEPAERVTLYVQENPNISGNLTSLYKNALDKRGVFPHNISTVQLGQYQTEIRYGNFFVKETKPDGDVYITEETTIDLVEFEEFDEEITPIIEEEEFEQITKGDFDIQDVLHSEVETAYEDIGGLDKEITRLKEIVGLPLRFPELFEKLGISPPQGLLLHGPPGTGKTLLARAVASEANANFMNASGPELAGSRSVSTAEKLQSVFEEARDEAPTILFIDEIDAIARKRERIISSGVREGVTELLTLMDGLEDRGDVVVIAATNRPEDLDAALRRGGRFTRELEIGVPSVEERVEILKVHTRGMSLSPDVNLEEFAEVTHGYVGADLETLVKEAGLAAIRRISSELDFESETVDAEVLRKLTIRKQDLKEGLAETTPSGMRDVAIETPDVSWSDIGGQTEAKTELRKAIEWPLRYSEGYKHLDLESPTGVLLYGPPGTGKTLIAKAVATEADANFISLKGSELISKWVGESAQNIEKLFAKARRNSPTVLFIDEIDALVPNRDGLQNGEAGQERTQAISQFLTELDGLESLEEVTIIGATNRKAAIDPAVLRSGRLESHIEVGAPDSAGREEILEIHTRNKPLADTVELGQIAARTQGYTGSDLERLCTIAAENVLEEALQTEGPNRLSETIGEKTIRMNHFESAIRTLDDDTKQTTAPTDTTQK